MRLTATSLVLAMTACSAAPPRQGVSTTSGEKPEHVPKAAHAGFDCASSDLPLPPDWALTPQAPVADDDSLTGMWIAVSGDIATVNGGSTPKPITQELSCYRSLRVMTLDQDGAHVRAVWVLRAASRGTLMVEWSRQQEVSAGVLAGGKLELEGVFVTERGSAELAETKRDCRPVTYSLAREAASGHLVGTRDGRPIRLAPFVVTPRTSPCGPPPP